MSEQLLAILKFCLLAVVYLFFFRVLRAVWAEISPPKVATVTAKPPASTRGAKPPKKSKQGAVGVPVPKPKGALVGRLVVTEPPEHRGRRYDIGSEISIGRASGCPIRIEDTFVSQVHARVFPREGNYLVEDLGSTNGTYLNRKKVAGPMTMQRGDRLQVGNTVLELE